MIVTGNHWLVRRRSSAPCVAATAALVAAHVLAAAVAGGLGVAAGARRGAASSDSGRLPAPSARGRRSRAAVAPRWRQNGRAPTAAELRGYVRERLIESRLTPNAISMTGLRAEPASPRCWSPQRLFFLAGIAFIVGSLMDTLDGRYSRMSGKGTPFGAFLDSTLDRIEEGIVLAAVAAYFAAQGDELAAAAVVLAVLGSLMVSYTRARAEALGVECKVGFATRPVRVVILSVGLVFAKGAGLGDFELLEPSIYVLAALTVFTVVPADLARPPGARGREQRRRRVTARAAARVLESL